MTLVASRRDAPVGRDAAVVASLRDAKSRCSLAHSLGVFHTCVSFSFFDPGQEVSVVAKRYRIGRRRGRLCSSLGTGGFLAAVYFNRNQRIERSALLVGRMGLDPRGDWKAAAWASAGGGHGRVKWALFQAWDELLDSAAGDCVLRRRGFGDNRRAELTAFDGERYPKADGVVVMPNHVHLLAAFPDEESMFAQCGGGLKKVFPGKPGCCLSKGLNCA